VSLSLFVCCRSFLVCRCYGFIFTLTLFDLALRLLELMFVFMCRFHYGAVMIIFVLTFVIRVSNVCYCVFVFKNCVFVFIIVFFYYCVAIIMLFVCRIFRPRSCVLWPCALTRQADVFYLRLVTILVLLLFLCCN